jgi:hypothetical protein
MAADNEPAAPAEFPPMNVEGVTGPATAETGIQAAKPSPTEIQAEPSAGAPDESIPLPPRAVKRRVVSPERLAAEARLLDRFIVGLVLIFSFLVGTFAIQNGPFWMHLATGRALMQGEYTFGDNPFSHPRTGEWVNHAWLFDAIVYELSVLGGGVESETGQLVLVLFRSLLVTLSACVLLSIRRKGQSLWAPAFFTMLAILTISVALPFQSILVSYLFLGVTLYLLTRPGKEPCGDEGQSAWVTVLKAGGAWWLLPILFALWVNLDGWFLLGPLAVGLYLAGEALGRLFAARADAAPAPKGRLRALALVFGVGLVACLANPYFQRALTLPDQPSYLLASANDWLEAKVGFAVPLPEQFTAAGKVWQLLGKEDPRYAAPFHSPFDFGRHFDWYTGTGWTVAGMAYYGLLLAGLVSFGLQPGWPWARFLVWLVFALLGGGQEAMVPFFAVVAGPITALNLQEMAAQRFGTQMRVDGYWKSWSLVGRLTTVGALLLLAVAAWPGWLHRQWWQRDIPAAHRVAWGIETDPVLQAAAQQLDHALPKGREGHAFNPNLQMGAYCAWFCPRDKTYFDHRVSLFADRIVPYIRVRKALVGLDNATYRREVFRRNQLDHLVLASPLTEGFGVGRQQCWLNPDEWVQPDVGEISTLFAWRDPAASDAAVPVLWKRTLDLNELAFDPKTVNKAPRAGPGVEPEPISGKWNPFAPPTGSVYSSWEAQASRLYGNYYSLFYTYFPAVYESASRASDWVTTAGPSGIGAGSPLGLAALAYASLPYDDRLKILAGMERKPGPPQLGRLELLLLTDRVFPEAAPVLAVRAARRAIRANPQDPEGYLALAEAYRWLWQEQEERWSRRNTGMALELSFAQLDQAPQQMLRVVQMVTALNRAVTLRPAAYEAHEMLRALYLRINYFDLAVDHQKLAVKARQRMLREMRRPPGMKPEVYKKEQDIFDRKLDEAEKLLKTMQDDLSRRQKDYRLQAANQNLMRKLGLALFLEYKVGTRTDRRGRGLAQEALKLLLNARAAEMDPIKAILQLKLLVTTGRIQDVRERLPDVLKVPGHLEREMEKQRGNRAQLAQMKSVLDREIPWLQALAAAANGDYTRAEASLQAYQDKTRSPDWMLQDVDPNLLKLMFEQKLVQIGAPGQLNERVQQCLVQLALSEVIYGSELHQKNRISLWPMQQNIDAIMNRIMAGLMGMLRRQAEPRLIRGLLALEQGDLEKAAALFEEVKKITERLGFRYTDAALAHRYLQAISRYRPEGGKKPGPVKQAMR